MLAKQTWRLLTRPDTLCAQVLKAKYYTTGDLLNAGPKSGSSFTWQSIVSGIQTFKRGHIGRVGNGRSINIWKDHRIPGNVSRKIDTVRGQNLLRTIEELINPATGLWDEELVRDTFHPFEAQKILEIPISPNLEDDFVAWHKTKSYTFSVRSAYYTEWEHQFRIKIGRVDGQGSSTTNPVWDILWKLSVPAKIKIFGWRALHGLIPGVGVLANGHIKVSA
jgi:hypothetical protein